MDLKSGLKVLLGRCAEALFPSAVRDLEDGANPDHRSRTKKLILFARMNRARKSGNLNQSEDALHQYWQTDFAHDFYDRFQDRFGKWFYGVHYPAIERLVRYANETGATRVVEIGCGDGQALDHISQKITGAQQFIGIDINPRIVEENKLRFASNPKLEFLSGNAIDWIRNNLISETLFYSYGGVLEYFSEESLTELLTLLNLQKGVAIALVEPVDPEHDMTLVQDSHLFGEESSFSHNYRYLLESCGFQIAFEDEVSTGKIRWVMMLAHTHG